MKRYFIPLGLSVLFFSCPFYTPTGDTYFKSYFLSDASFVIDGELFSIVNMPNEISPKEFDRFVVKANAVDNWEVVAKKKSESKYELTIDVTSENLVINKETINQDFIVLLSFFDDGMIPNGFPICSLRYEIDNLHVWQPSYRQPRDWDPQQELKYDYLEYVYVYVAEALTVYEQKTIEYDLPWKHIETYHYDLNFSKPGWYKICSFNMNYNNSKFRNDIKHNTGRNTNFYFP
jgi:hypothetical protein